MPTPRVAVLLGAFAASAGLASTASFASAPAASAWRTCPPTTVRATAAFQHAPQWSKSRRPTRAHAVRGSVPPDLVGPLAEAPWRTGLEPAEECATFEAPTVEGALPNDLIGTLFRNGAGRIRVGDSLRYGHWFDGDGFVSAATLTGDGRCLFRQRYLRGPKLLAQEKVGTDRIGPRGVWTQAGGAGRGKGPLWANAGRVPVNPLNTNVLVLEKGAKAGKVLALCEGGPPYEIDPVSLALGAPETFGGEMKSFFSAHPKIDPATGTIYNQGVILGPSPKLNLMKISPAGELLLQRAFPMPGLLLVHDFVMAGRFLVVFLSPYGTTPKGLVKSLLGLTPLGATYRWRDDEPTRALVFDKESLTLVHDVPVFPPVSNYHFINGWERPATEGEGGAATVVEVLVAKHRSPREAVESQFKDMYRAFFTPALECETWRYALRVDPAAGVSGGALLEAQPLSLAQSSPGYELPTINPRVVGKQHRFAYVNSLIRQEGFVDSVSKVDLAAGGRFQAHTASLPEGCFASEAVFVPRSEPTTGEEDDGYLLFYTYDRHRGASDLVVLDAQDVERPPLAVVRLPVRVPYSYHGAWTPRTFGIEKGKSS